MTIIPYKTPEIYRCKDIPPHVGETMNTHTSIVKPGGSEHFHYRDHMKRPLIKTTLNLVSTYKKINEDYYAKKFINLKYYLETNSQAALTEIVDPQLTKLPLYTLAKKVDCYFQKYHSLILNNFKEIYTGGYGTVYFSGFSRRDNPQEMVPLAIKVNLVVQNSLYAIQQEGLWYKSKLKDVPHVIKLLDYINISQRQSALVFKYRSGNDLCTKYYYSHKGMSFNHLKVFASQLAHSLQSLKLKGLVHADLKPDNMFYNEERKKLTIFDFGIAFDEKNENKFPTTLQTIFYRAPEVFLNKGTYDHNIDLWSFGCILFELFTGKILFGLPNNITDIEEQTSVSSPASTEEKNRQRETQKFKNYIALFVERLGIPPIEFLKKCQNSHYYFQKDIDENCSLKNTISKLLKEKHVTFYTDTISELINSHAIETGQDLDKAQSLADLISSLVTYENRIPTEMILTHPFLQ